MTERIIDYKKYLDPLSSEYIEPGINPHASYTAGYTGPIGEMRGPKSNKLYNAGTTMYNIGLPGIGESLRNVGAGLRLEPANYVQSALEGLALVPGPQAVTTAARIAGPVRQFGTSYAKQQTSPYDVASSAELRNAYYDAVNRSVLADRQINNPAFLKMLPEEHTAALMDYRKNAELARNLKGYKDYPVGTRPSYGEHAAEQQRLFDEYNRRERAKKDMQSAKFQGLLGAGRGAELARKGLVLHELGFDPSQQYTQQPSPLAENRRQMR